MSTSTYGSDLRDRGTLAAVVGLLVVSLSIAACDAPQALSPEGDPLYEARCNDVAECADQARSRCAPKGYVVVDAQPGSVGRVRGPYRLENKGCVVTYRCGGWYAPPKPDCESATGD